MMMLDLLRNFQQIVSVNAFVLTNLVILANATRKNHDAALCVSSRVQKIVTFLAEV